MENYEQKYKELVKNFSCVLKLQSVKESGIIPVDDVRKLIPELKESEDERIKRCIQVALTDVDEKRFNDYDTTLKDCLAWLEKQGEQKPEEIRGNFGGISSNWSEKDEKCLVDIS